MGEGGDGRMDVMQREANIQRMKVCEGCTRCTSWSVMGATGRGTGSTGAKCFSSSLISYLSVRGTIFTEPYPQATVGISQFSLPQCQKC